MTKDRYAAAQDFDKAMLTLSASALAFSMALLKFIGTNAVAASILQVSWLFFSLSVVATVIALFSSYHAFDQEVKNADLKFRIDGREYLAAYEVPEALYSFDDPPVEPSTGWEKVLNSTKGQLARIIEVANILAMVFFIVGMITLLTFGKMNLNRKELDMASDRRTSRGGMSASPTGRPVSPIIVKPMDQGPSDAAPAPPQPAPPQPVPESSTPGESGGSKE